MRRPSAGVEWAVNVQVQLRAECRNSGIIKHKEDLKPLNSLGRSLGCMGRTVCRSRGGQAAHLGLDRAGRRGGRAVKCRPRGCVMAAAYSRSAGHTPSSRRLVWVK